MNDKKKTLKTRRENQQKDTKKQVWVLLAQSSITQGDFDHFEHEKNEVKKYCALNNMEVTKWETLLYASKTEKLLALLKLATKSADKPSAILINAPKYRMKNEEMIEELYGLIEQSDITLVDYMTDRTSEQLSIHQFFLYPDPRNVKSNTKDAA